MPTVSQRKDTEVWIMSTYNVKTSERERDLPRETKSRSFILRREKEREKREREEETRGESVSPRLRPLFSEKLPEVNFSQKKR